MSTSFGTGATRQVQAGDTPDLNDGLLSREASVVSIVRGQACYLIQGLVTVATEGNSNDGNAAFVPIESVDNSGDDNLPISGVVSPQRVALTIGTDAQITLNPGDYVQISDTAGQVTPLETAAIAGFRYARFLGIEAALLDVNASTPFDETLTPGIVPDQSVTVESGETAVGWFQLVEAQGALTIV